ncbi:hypothetical protein DXN05_12280 [Deminuibacter soli]|uniref:Uncharacterized protein n=1 Tax=Deminuibacter soli TaxID=2291815 RepID=A0A3E1NK41_9BACT|nr:hypothetical protein DXN05_12280 [Deminuibacter soli]
MHEYLLFFGEHSSYHKIRYLQKQKQHRAASGRLQKAILQKEQSRWIIVFLRWLYRAKAEM